MHVLFRLLLCAMLVQPVLAAAAPTDGSATRHGGPERSLAEPVLRLPLQPGAAPRVALTLDACMGAVDRRILDTLVAERIPATIFVTARWLKHNGEAIAILKAHPDLFEIENHGRDHLAPVDHPATIWGVHAAGSPEALTVEVEGGTEAIVAAGFDRPLWFRGATARYSASAITRIEALGYRIGGFSLNGDGGSLLGAHTTARRIAAARDGDVIIAHINQPTHAAGSGVVEGVRALRKRGFDFVLLRDAEAAASAPLNSQVLAQ
jgi:peptidoglycan/xylan/chitin deacetylase (PgdA/CDA1 family)